MYATEQVTVKAHSATRTGDRLFWVLRRTCAPLGLGILLLACLELFYRVQLVDMYKPELRAYNSSTDLAEGRDTVLALGDSFTAGSSYVSYLRLRLSQYRIINGGIPGTGVVQAALVVPHRFGQFHPSIFIYQVYVGNDLFDLRYPVNWQSNSIPRNLYWLIANRLRALSFLNYRFAQMTYNKKSLQPDLEHATGAQALFSEARYSWRPAIYLRAEPALIEDTVLVRGERARDYERYVGILRNMLGACQSDSCEAYILVIPHCAQLNTRYLNNFRRLGAVFSDPDAFQQVEYPFISRLREELSSMPNVRVVNALPDLRGTEEKGREVYYRNDEHLSAVGHEIVAGLLATEITQSATRRNSLHRSDSLHAK